MAASNRQEQISILKAMSAINQDINNDLKAFINKVYSQDYLNTDNGGFEEYLIQTFSKSKGAMTNKISILYVLHHNNLPVQDQRTLIKWINKTYDINLDFRNREFVELISLMRHMISSMDAYRFEKFVSIEDYSVLYMDGFESFVPSLPEDVQIKLLSNLMEWNSSRIQKNDVYMNWEEDRFLYWGVPM